MRKSNIGGCNCFDCNNGRFPDRTWLKRFWRKEVEEELLDCSHTNKMPHGALCNSCFMRDERCMDCGKRFYHLGEYR